MRAPGGVLAREAGWGRGRARLSRRLGLLLALLPPAAACTRPDPGLDEISRTWRSTAPVDDTYDMDCNDARMAVAEPLGKRLQAGLSREEVIRLLGEPDSPPHIDVDHFGPDNLNYSMGFCRGDYASFVVMFKRGRSRDGWVTYY